MFVFVLCRMMYWSVIGDHSHIEESAMDGSLRRVLLEKNLRRPTGRCFDQRVQIPIPVFLIQLSTKNVPTHTCILASQFTLTSFSK